MFASRVPARLLRRVLEANTLADGHEKTQWAGVPVLEEVQSHAALRGQLVRHFLACFAAAGGHDVAIAGLKLEVVEVAGDLRYAVVSGLLSSGRFQLVTTHAARAGVVVVGSLKVLLLREEEDNGASLALVAGRDVKVEDAARGAVDLAKVRGAVALVGRVLVDWNDEVRSLVRSLIQSGCASVAIAAVSGAGARWLSCGGSVATLAIAPSLSGLCGLGALSGLLVGLSGLVAIPLGLGALSWLLIRLGLRLIGGSGHSRCAALVTTVAALRLAGAWGSSLSGRGDKSQAAASRDTAGAIGVRVGWVARVCGGLRGSRRLTAVATLRLSGAWGSSLSGRGDKSQAAASRDTAGAIGVRVGRVASVGSGLCRGRRLITIAALRLGRSGSGPLRNSGTLLATIAATVATAVAATIALAFAAGAQGDLGALVLALDLLSVDVVLVLISRAGVEGVVPVVLELSIAGDGEAAVGRGTRVTLELGGRWREDTSATRAVGDGSIRGEAVLSVITASPANAVLAIAQLPELTGLASRCRQGEATALLSWKDGAGCP